MTIVHDTLWRTLTLPDNAAGVPVMPTVSAVATATMALDAGAANLLIGVRATPAAPDDITAAERLSTLFSAAQIGLDNVCAFYLDSGATRVDVVGVMNGAATGNCMGYDGTTADATAQKVTFEFSTAVHKIVVTASPGFASGQEAHVVVEGYSYA
jgi:hypothetical protein